VNGFNGQRHYFAVCRNPSLPGRNVCKKHLALARAEKRREKKGE
jgi:hypothetical protein